MVLDVSAHYEVAVPQTASSPGPGSDPSAQSWPARAGRSGPSSSRSRQRADSWGSDTVALGYEDADGSPHVLAELDGRYLSTEVTGGFLGRTIGLYAVDGDGRVRLVRLPGHLRWQPTNEQ